MGTFAAVHGLSSCGRWVWLLWGMQNLSSQTRDQTRVPKLVGRFLTLDHQGSPSKAVILKVCLFVYFTDGCSRFSVPAHSLSLDGPSGGYSLVAVCGLLIPAPSSVAAHGL